MKASPGTILLGLVMNVLSGRSPIYRVEEFFRARDAALLLGEDITAEMLNDDAIGRALDRIYEYGTWKIFSEVCVQAFRSFGVDCSVVHHDTTSVSVWGEYESSANDPLHITHGFSKDKRPDLKQFMLSLLCVEGNLPCHGGVLSGNAPDKKTNGKRPCRASPDHGEPWRKGLHLRRRLRLGDGGESLPHGGEHPLHHTAAGELQRLRPAYHARPSLPAPGWMWDNCPIGR